MRTGDRHHAIDQLSTLCAFFGVMVALTFAPPPLSGQTPEGTPAGPPVAAEAAPAVSTTPATAGCGSGDGGCACCGGGAARESGGMGCMGGMGRMRGASTEDEPPAGATAGRGRGPGMGRGMGRGMGGGNAGLMHGAMALVHQRQRIERTVEEIPGGVRTRTVVEGEDADLTRTLVDHVEGMAGLLERGGRIRNWDPLFSELFDHAAAITLEVEEIPGGVLVVETSEDPEVAKLIRAHAYKVDEFLARGHGAVHESTPLPEDYRRPGSD